MFIFNKKTDTIINTELIKKIKIRYGIYNDRNITAIYCDDNNIAEYKTPERAREVLRQIFIAMTDGLKAFELPAD